MPYDVHIGRLNFPTVFDSIKEVLGDGLAQAGASLVAGERRAREFPLALPVYGDATTDPRGGDSLRRKLRALLQNPRVLSEGLYFRFDVDPELNGWLMVGGGDLEYADGGVSFSDYRVELKDCYRVGGPRTHRPARRLETYDRRVSSIPRDYLGAVYSTAFANQTALALHTLPVGARALRGYGDKPVTYGSRDALRGELKLLSARAHGEVVRYAQSEADHHLNDVLVFDRQSQPTPTFTQEGDKYPEVAYGWEEVYGPDQPLTTNDLPVVENGLCRLRLVAPAVPALILEAYVAGSGYVEQGRLTVWNLTGTQGTLLDYEPVFLLPSPSLFPSAVEYLERGDESEADPASRAVLEWTPERAVVRLSFVASTGQVLETYVTLQRGWTAPRIEVYGRAVSNMGVLVRYTPREVAAVFATEAASAAAKAVQSDETWAGTLALADTDAPWAALTPKPVAGAQPPTLQLAAIGPSTTLARADDLTTYGAMRRAVEARSASAAAPYVSAQLGFGAAPAEPAFEAESYRNVGTTTSVADAAAGAGNAVEDTQAAATVATVIGPAVGRRGRVGIWVRARAVTAGATVTARGRVNGVTASGGDVALTSVTYKWLHLGDVAVTTATHTVQVLVWRSAGTGNVRIDRVATAMTERRDASELAYDGARDLMQTHLYESNAVPTIVPT